MIAKDLQAFRNIVYTDAALAADLYACADLPNLHALIRTAAAARGLVISDDDLTAIASSNTRSWLERWI